MRGPQKYRFTLVELLLVMAIGFSASAVLLPLLHQTTLLVRSRHRLADQHHQMAIIRRQWRNVVRASQVANWQVTSDGRFRAVDMEVGPADDQLLVKTARGTQRLRLPRGANVQFTLEQTIQGHAAVLHLQWPDPDSRRQRLYRTRIVACSQTEVN